MHLEPEMTYVETIDGPWGPTAGGPAGDRLCWQVTTAALRGPRNDAGLAAPGADWMRLGTDGIRRPDLRATLATADGAVILFSYDTALIRASDLFLAALREGTATAFDDKYMRMAARFETGDPRYRWLTESLFVGQGRLAGDHRIEYEICRVG
jgi:hypothetical protein